MDLYNWYISTPLNYWLSLLASAVYAGAYFHLKHRVLKLYKSRGEALSQQIEAHKNAKSQKEKAHIQVVMNCLMVEQTNSPHKIKWRLPKWLKQKQD